MAFVEYIERPPTGEDVEYVFVSRETGKITSRMKSASKSLIMDMYDHNRLFIDGQEFVFEGRDIVKKVIQ